MPCSSSHRQCGLYPADWPTPKPTACCQPCPHSRPCPPQSASRSKHKVATGNLCSGCCTHGQIRRKARIRSRGYGSRAAYLLLLGVTLACFGASPSRAALLYHQQPPGIQPQTLRQWQSLLERTPVRAFEDAYQAVFGAAAVPATPSGNLTQAQQHYDQLLSWLLPTRSPALSTVQELQNHHISGVVQETMTLAAMQPGSWQEDAAIASLQLITSKLTQATSRHGYPFARRVFLAAIIKQRAAQGPFSKPVQLLVDRILLQFFALHKRSAAHRGAVQFFHISKSGGTNLCMAAGANGCSSQGFDERHNCLIKEFMDVPKWVSATAHKAVYGRLMGMENEPQDTINPWYISYQGHSEAHLKYVNFHSDRNSRENCAERRHYLKFNGWDFFANEFSLPPGESSVCREFVNLMMWRHPLDRLTSQIGWIQKLYHDSFGSNALKVVFSGRTSSFWERLLPAAVSNYYIRSLLGSRFFEYPLHAINSTHVQHAKVQVLLHDLLLLLSNKEWNDLTLKFGLGWETGLHTSNIRSSAVIKDEIQLPVDYDVLQNHNLPDVEVYEFVQQVAALDVVLWSFVASLDAQLGLRNTSTKKCGYVNLATT